MFSVKGQILRFELPKTALNNLKPFLNYCNLKVDIFQPREMNSGCLINIHEAFYDIIKAG